MSANGEARVEIVEPDPGWPAAFRQERERLLEVLAPWLAGPIEHVGSTAVAGLPAKPVIDVMAAVADLDASRPAIAAAEASAGYVYFAYKPDVMHWFCKPSPEVRTHHLHLVPFESRLWVERLAFRDALRDDAELAAEYAALKRSLAARFPHDREAYTDGKGPFVRAVLNRVIAD